MNTRTHTALLPAAVSAALVAGLLAAGCGNGPFSDAEVLGGQSVDAATLNRGYRAYQFYCVACHGADGDGRGPASAGLQTPPRDFRIATYKFAGVTAGSLPHDEDLIALIEHGLEGTAMLPWDVPPAVIADVVQYIKTFSPDGEGWRDPEAELGEPIAPGDDPWGDGKQDEAVERGRAVYHALANCHGCHPAYETHAELSAQLAEMNKPAAGLREEFWMSEPKASVVFTRPAPGDAACESETDCDKGQSCVLGRCELPVVILPPDFTINEVRTGDELESLFRVIAAGIPGTAMPAWSGAIDDKDIWAIAYFIRHLLREVRGTPAAIELRDRLKASVR